MTDLTIEGSPAELEWLRREIEATIGPEAKLEAVPLQDDDELSEPILIGLIVSLGGPVIVRSIRDVLKRRYQHVEEMKRLDNELRETEMKNKYEMTELRLKYTDGSGETHPIDEDDLESLAS